MQSEKFYKLLAENWNFSFHLFFDFDFLNHLSPDDWLNVLRALNRSHTSPAFLSVSRVEIISNWKCHKQMPNAVASIHILFETLNSFICKCTCWRAFDSMFFASALPGQVRTKPKSWTTKSKNYKVSGWIKRCIHCMTPQHPPPPSPLDRPNGTRPWISLTCKRVRVGGGAVSTCVCVCVLVLWGENYVCENTHGRRERRYRIIFCLCDYYFANANFAIRRAISTIPCP